MNRRIVTILTEKFWSPVRAGTLPLYYGPKDFAPPGIVDCRDYDAAHWFDVRSLAYDLANMSDKEHARRVNELLDWYYDLPRDAAHRAKVAAAEYLARVVCAALH